MDILIIIKLTKNINKTMSKKSPEKLWLWHTIKIETLVAQLANMSFSP